MISIKISEETGCWHCWNCLLSQHPATPIPIGHGIKAKKIISSEKTDNLQFSICQGSRNRLDCGPMVPDNNSCLIWNHVNSPWLCVLAIISSWLFCCLLYCRVLGWQWTPSTWRRASHQALAPMMACWLSRITLPMSKPGVVTSHKDPISWSTPTIYSCP